MSFEAFGNTGWEYTCPHGPSPSISSLVEDAISNGRRKEKAVSGSVIHHEPRSGWNLPLARRQPRLEWQAWVAKGRARDLRKSAARVKAVKWVAIAVLLVTATQWSQLTPYHVVFRFVVAGAALVVMSQALHVKNYALAAVFGVVALLYNPVVPALDLSGDWQRAVAVASALPFLASLVWATTRTEHNV